VAEHSKTDHEDIVLDSGQLADPELRRTVITARDIPAGMGDMDFSLYLLFKAIRSRSTVALSGESADEVFGGYKWFHTPEAQQANTFPWMVFGFQRHGQVGDVLEPGLRKRLDLQTYIDDAYQQAISLVDRLPGEDDHTYRMRKISHLHLTRFVRNLLDRKDRMSMAVGLEVRVPFCDHRLVEYVYNAPWALKTYDSREKSLLRGATADVLPQSVLGRVKSPYPSTQDVGYLVALQQQAKELVADPSNPVFEVISRDWVTETVGLDAAEVKWGRRFGLERALDMAVWLDLYRPTLNLS
jgi:asparagine synthase (glutamine-hydrolysing)